MIDENSRKKNNSIAVLGACLLICISGVFCVKAKPVDFTLQNMLVILTAASLGGAQAAGAAGLFLTAGALGLPVFAGGGRGLAYLTQTFSGSFVLGYFIAALVVGFYTGTPKKSEPIPVKKLIIGCVLGYILVYVPPVASLFNGGIKNFAEFAPFLPTYLIVDLIKCAVTVPLALVLRKKFATEEE